MQLSAPTLPFDSNAPASSDGSGFPPSAGKGADHYSKPGDFGAMLSAKSRGESADRWKANADDSGSKSGRVLNKEAPSPEVTAESLLATDGLPVPQLTPVQKPITAEAELDFTFTGIKAGSGIEGAETLAPTSPTGADPLSLKRGDSRRPVGEVLASKIGATLRAYGLTGEGRAMRSISSDQSAAGNEVSASPLVSGSVDGSHGARVSASAVEPIGSKPAADLQPLITETVSVAGVQDLDFAKSATDEAVSIAKIVSPETDATNAPKASISRPTVDLNVVPEVRGEQNLPLDAGLVAAKVSEPFALQTAPFESLASKTEQADSGDTTITPAASDDAKPDTDIEPNVFTAVMPEKIAVQLSRKEQPTAVGNKSAQKVSLDIQLERVTDKQNPIGINVAKPEALMSAPATLPAPPSIALENASVDTTRLSFDALIKEGSESGAGQLSMARRAVESVLTAADQIATGEQRSVRLQFTVGGEELAVRVDFRGDRVHTTFRTDSSELRSALAHEWQSVSAVQSGVRTQRLADPVFASHSSGNGQSFSSDSGSAHHRDPGHQQSQIPPDEIYGARRAFSNTTVVPPAMAAAPATAAEVLNPLRLQTFA